ncbi:MAG: Gx transporter family protein [Coriobacteriia bacterium]|nr:Gx transporter family protein [Coriobacteriia bacterium]
MDSTLASARADVAAGMSRQWTVTAGLLAIACVLGLIEAALPGVPFAPWLRLGLANIAVVVALALDGGRMALIVSLGRVLIVGVAAGTIGSPAFVIGGAGALASLGVMWALARIGDLFSPVGWSAAGAVAHMLAQFVVASAILGSWSILMLAPVSMLLALPLGALTGALARTIVSRLRVC